MYKAYALDESKIFKDVSVANKSKEVTSQKAKMALVGAIIGLVIVLMAFAIVNFVIGNI